MKKKLFIRKLLALALCLGMVLSTYTGVVVFGEETEAVSTEEDASSEIKVIGAEGASSQPDGDSEEDVVSQPEEDKGIAPAADGHTYQGTGWWYLNITSESKTPASQYFDENGTDPDTALNALMARSPQAQAYFFPDGDYVPTEGWRNFTLSEWQKVSGPSPSEFAGWVKSAYTAAPTAINGTTFDPTDDTFTIDGNDASIFTLEVYVPEDPTKVTKDRHGVTAWNPQNVGGFQPDNVAYYGLNLSAQNGYDPDNPEDFDFEGFADTLNGLYTQIKVYRNRNPKYPNLGTYGYWEYIPVTWTYAGPHDSVPGYLYKADTGYQFYWDTTDEPVDFYIFLLNDSEPVVDRPGVTRWNFSGADGFLDAHIAYYVLPESERENFIPEDPEAFETNLNVNTLYQTIKVNRVMVPGVPPVGQYGDWLNIPVKWVYDERQEDEFFSVYTYKAETDYNFFWNTDGEPADFYIYVPGEYHSPLDEDDLKRHIVSPQEPEALTINLFDYWADDSDHSAEGEFGDFTVQGINKGHHLKFRTSTDWWLGNEVVGQWNANSGVNDTGGIVASRLNADGYPVLQLTELEPYNRLPSIYGDETSNNDKAKFDEDATADKLTESLEYLFSPDKKFDGNGRDSYLDVNGLLKLDNDGNYAFSARKNYAYYDTDQGDGGDFTLYDTWGIIAGGESPNGQFFPFVNPLESTGYPNTGVFIGEENGALVQAPKPSENNGMGFDSNSPGANHWMGMTLETNFVQPVGGKLNTTTPMTFTFRGDDDIWVFIDGVLVIDLSGIHSSLGAKIDFSTGEVTHFNVNADGTDGGPLGGRGSTTLKDLFEAALTPAELANYSWNGDTFGTYTQHTLKMFFLERGAVDSNFALTYNLVQPNADRVRKVDEDGNPLEGVTFDVYVAYEQSDGTFSEGDKITSTVTDHTGHGEFLDSEKEPVYFADVAKKYGTNYFLLRETGTPPGYRANPDMILTLNLTTETFTVVNKWQTGAYGSFTAYFTQQGTSGLLAESGEEVSQTDLLDGLVLVVPALTPQNSGIQPLYGSNTTGWDVVVSDEIGEKAAVAEAAFRHMRAGDNVNYAETGTFDDRIPDYYLSWERGDQRLKGTLNNLPGDPSRYAQNNGGEAVGKYLFISEESLEHFDEALGTNLTGYDNAEDRYMALKAFMNTEAGFDAALDLLSGDHADHLKLLSAADFTRDYRSVIYVPNEQRRLQLRKTDGEGNPVPGAIFAIFDTAKNAAEFEVTGTTAEGILQELLAARMARGYGLLSFGQTVILPGETDATLTFEETGDDGDFTDGTAHIAWPPRQMVGDGYTDVTDSVYWMREIYAPAGYEVNPYLIRIAGGDQAIYAHATGFKYNAALQKGELLTGDEAAKDHIRVQSGLGKLAQTLVKYAASDYVDVTLRDITIYKQRQEEEDLNGVLGPWEDDDTEIFPPYNLHYGRHNEGLTGQYGLHDDQYNEGQVPVYIVDDGYVRVMPRQNLHFDGYIPADGSLTVLGDTDLNALFGLMNIVIVEDPMIAPRLKIEKWQAVTASPSGNPALNGDPQQETIKVSSGDKITYYFKITNIGTGVAENVKFTDKLPEAAGYQLSFAGGIKQYASADWTNGSAAVTGTVSNGVLTITKTGTADLGNLDPGESIYLSFDATVPNDNDGSTIAKSVTWTNGAITEFAVNKDAAYWIKADDPEAIYGPQKSNEVALVTGATGGLTVRKTVTGGGGDRTKDFTFTVTLIGDGAKDIDAAYDGVDFEDGVGVFTLKHGESKTFENLPAGLGYTVTESDNEGYTVTKTGDAGEIPEDDIAEAAFVNDKQSAPVGGGNTEDDPNLDVDPSPEPDPDDPDNPDNPGTSPSPEPGASPSPKPGSASKPSSGSPQTSDPGNLGLWVGMMAGSGTGLAATVLLPKRKKRYRHLKAKYRHLKK